MEERVHHISIRKTKGFNLLTRTEFMEIPSEERNRLILNKRVQFLDAAGLHIPLLEGIRSISLK